MTQEQLIPGENILQFSDKGIITLTTHRIRYHSNEWGNSNFISIMLEKISSIYVVYNSYPILWIIGGLLALIGFIMECNERYGNHVGLFLMVSGALLIVGYFISRRHICAIASDGGTKILFRTEGMSTDAVIYMMDKIELAKAKRVEQLK